MPLQRRVKNGAMIAAAIVALCALIGGDMVWSYWQGMRAVVRDGIRGGTSIPFDLARLDQAIEAITPVLQENKRTVAELDVEIEFLESDTAEIEEAQTLANKEMVELREALDGKGSDVLIDGKKYSRAEVEADLLRRLQAYQSTEEQLSYRKSLLSKRRQTLQRAIVAIQHGEQQQQMLAQKAEFLSAELQMLEVTAATNGFALTPMDLANAQTLATEIHKKVRTLEKLCDQEESQEGIEVNLDRRTAAERYDELFGSSSK